VPSNLRSTFCCSDIKGGNILVSASGTVMLSDFGSAHRTVSGYDGGNLDTDSEMVGTPYFMALEVLSGARQNIDVFVLVRGVMLWRCV
jgi:serine/threonine protein kinase